MGMDSARSVVVYGTGVIAVAGLALVGDPNGAFAVSVLGGVASLTGRARWRRGVWAGDPHLHLARCKRRDEGAEVLVVRLSGPQRRRLKSVLQKTMRITDSLTARTAGDTEEIYGVLDGPGVDRKAILTRLGDVLPGPPAVGWASFPQDGVTLEVLVAHARASIAAPEPLLCERRTRFAKRSFLRPPAASAHEQVAEQQGLVR